MFCIMTTFIANAQLDPGGLGSSSGDTTTGGIGTGADVSDVSGGSGTNGGTQGGEAPIDGGIVVLFAIGAIYTGIKLSKRKGLLTVN